MSQFLSSGGQSIGVPASVLQGIFRADFFRIDWFDLLAVQGTLTSLLQHHSLKATILPLYLPYKIRLPVERVEISLMLLRSL